MRRFILFALMCLACIGVQTEALAKSPANKGAKTPRAKITAEGNLYAVLGDDMETLTIYYDGDKDKRGGVTEWWNEYSISTVATKAVFDESVSDALPTSTASWFSSFSQLNAIEGINHLNTSEVTDMHNMFFACHNLQNLDLRTFNTEKVTDMGSMFYGCSSLSQLDLRSFVTYNVTDMSAMFDGCTALQTISLGDDFNTANVTTMLAMFRGCTALYNISRISEFFVEKITTTYGMFDGCASLVYLDLSNWQTFALTETESMFADCSSLVTLDLSHIDMSKVTNASKMFYGCTALTYLVIDDDWSKLSNLNSSYNIFMDCTSLVGGKGTKYDHLKVDNTYARTDGGEEDKGYFCTKRPQLYAVATDGDTKLTFYFDAQRDERGGKIEWDSYSYTCQSIDFDPSVANARPINTRSWFGSFEQLKEINHLDYLNTEAVEDMSYMFAWCLSLTSLDLSNLKTRNVREMEGMFIDCENLETVMLYNFDTRNVTNMSYMFKDCNSLRTLDLSNFRTGNAESMQSMFSNCASLTSISLTNFDTRNVKNMSGMFANCTMITMLDIRSFTTESLEDAQMMFYGCSELAYIINPNDWTTCPAVALGQTDDMFSYCSHLRGSNGTEFNETYNDISRARPDEGEGAEGYFCATLPEMYAVTSEHGTLLTLFYDSNREKQGGVTFWADETNRKNVKRVILDGSMAYYRPTDLSFWMAGMEVLEEIENMYLLNTSETMNMTSMFDGCKMLQAFDLNSFDTRNVTSMAAMFKDCSAIVELDLEWFNTEKVNTYSRMFEGCTGLEAVYMRTFGKYDGPIYVNAMFSGCSSLKAIYWYSDLTTQDEFYGEDMFKGCTSLQGSKETAFSDSYTGLSRARLDGGEGKEGYFSQYNENEDYSVYDPATTTLTFYCDNMRFQHEGIDDDYSNRAHKPEYESELTKVVFMPSCAHICPESTADWFNNCINLETIEGLQYLNTFFVKDMSNMFRNCAKLKELDIHKFKMDDVHYTSYMFAGCTALQTIICNIDWNELENIYYSENMFLDCTSLKGGNGTVFDDSKEIDITFARPDGVNGQPGYFTKALTYKVTLVAENGTITVTPSDIDLDNVEPGQLLTLVATPEYGYQFAGWKNYDPATGLTVNSDITVTALFEPQVFTLTVNVEPAEGGTFKIDGVDEFNKAPYMTPFSIEATANDGYEFVGWKDGDMMLDEKSTTMSSVLYGDVTITIIFNKKDTETALDETAAGEGAAKVLRNGVLYILREGRTYDVSGRLVE